MSSPVLMAVFIAVFNHLWQSTVLAGAAAGLTLLMRTNSARLRYLAWLAASLKFLVPCAGLAALGGAVGAQIPWPGGPILAARIGLPGPVMSSVMLPGGQGAAGPHGAAHAVGSGSVLLIFLAALWALGAAAVGVRWWFCWRAMRREVCQSAASSLPFVIPVRRGSMQVEPAVVGVLRPVLLLPEGLERRLLPAELSAVLAHERCHVRWQDNLTGALHMLVEMLFWFHPLVWWLGARLIVERERACDEQVLAEGHAPRAYAEAILKVCKHFLQSPVPCAAGVGGASLKHRIEDIMNHPWIEKLSGFKRALIIIVAAGAVAGPVAFGLLTASRAQAQAAPPASGEPAFTHVSIQASTVSNTQCSPPAGAVDGCYSFLFRPGGKVLIENSTLRPLIAAAYHVEDTLVLGRPWSEEPRYNITADFSGGPPEAASAAVRDLLTRRFGVVVKHELRQMNGYVLMISSAGSKLKATQLSPNTPRQIYLIGPDGKPLVGSDDKPNLASVSGWHADNMPMSALVQSFAMGLHVPVVDETGLQGDYAYSYVVQWQPGAAPDPATLNRTLEEQLGLHLEARPLNVDTINVVSVKPPQEVLTAQR